jgi:short-subunit dehydrogenase
MHILITGAAQGIGAAMAKQLATSGHVLTLVDMNESKLTETADALRTSEAKINTFVGDLTKADTIAALDSRLAQAEDKLDVLVNNAGVAHQLKRFEELSDSEFDLNFAVNVKAPFDLAKLALKYMIPQGGGVIINVASRANVYGYMYMGVYAATKAAITSFTGTIALENKDKGIRAYTVIPGRTNTPMQVNLRGEQEAQSSQSPEYVGQIVAELVHGKIQIESGDSILVSFGEYKVLPELDRSELHKKMN